MKITKRSWVVLLLLIVALLTRCSGQNSSNTTGTTIPEEIASESSESAQTTVEISEGTDSNETEDKTADHTQVTEYDKSITHDAKALADGENLVGGTYTATGNDESAVEASGNVTATVTGSLLQKLSGKASSADGSSFYGLNSCVRVYDQATLTVKDCEITAEADNATGVFAYDEGTVYISDSIVTVSGGGAGGIQVAGGGTLYANDLNVTSASKAAIRSDRGGGVMIIDGGIYTSTGSNGCPAIYSTADITVSNAECLSTNSRAVIIEGKNSVTLNNCTLVGNDQSSKEGSVRANVLLYQSASGDAKEGTSVFTMTGGSMKSLSGAMFYCTNTSSRIYLTGTELILSDDGTLLIVSEGRWGKSGKNGGNCVFCAEHQTLTGDIIVDSISSLEMSLTDSIFTGSIQSDGDVSIRLDDSSVWTLTGDSYVTEFEGNEENVIGNGYTLYVNGVALTGIK